jgi:hypothetical protein
MMQYNRKSINSLKSVELSSVVKLCSEINSKQDSQNNTASNFESNKVLNLIEKHILACKIFVLAKSPITQQQTSQTWKINHHYNVISIS